MINVVYFCLIDKSIVKERGFELEKYLFTRKLFNGLNTINSMIIDTYDSSSESISFPYQLFPNDWPGNV